MDGEYCTPRYDEEEKKPRMFSGKWFVGLLKACWIPSYTAREHMVYTFSSMCTDIKWVAILVATGVWTWAKAIAFFKGLALAVKNAVLFMYMLVAAVFKYAFELIP